MTPRILVLGGTGMLGAMMVRVLREQGLHVEFTCRDPLAIPMDKRQQSGWHLFKADSFQSDTIYSFLERADWIINCIGITKPVIDADPSKGTLSAIKVNALFPCLLARSLSSHQRLIQIATDCVYSGKSGSYKEDDPHDALDVYGKTKSLGEYYLPNVMHLRCSIIGPEYREQKKFLLEWLLGQAQGATVNGYLNHTWNGLTTLHFAKVCAAIINIPALFEGASVHHLSPANVATKYQLLYDAAAAFGREDIMVERASTPECAYRHLSTNNPSLNRALWQGAGYGAGYDDPPSIQQMLDELAAYMRCSTIGDITRKRL